MFSVGWGSEGSAGAAGPWGEPGASVDRVAQRQGVLALPKPSEELWGAVGW